MHVGLNLIYLVPRETGGTEIYARELIPALRAVAPEMRLTAFVNREAAASQGPWHDVDTITVPVSATRRIEWVRGEQILLPRLASRAGVDVVHSLANTGPVRGGFARVVTVHDLLYMMVPESHFGIRGLGMRVLVPAAARRSDRVVTISESTKADLISRLKVPAERIDVVLNGIGNAPGDDVAPEPELRARLGLGERPIALSVSTKRPHKNLMNLLEAHALIPPEERPILVLPGYHTPHEDELRARARALGTEADVVFLGWLESGDLEGLYRAARLFVFTSRYEGFGLPVAEAMARGLPVACSGVSAIAEVAGDATLLFDPDSPDAIAGAIRSLLADDALRDRLIAAGRERAAAFSWEKTARSTVASYERALAGRAAG